MNFANAWWLVAVVLAWFKGGFWWIFLNVFIPISPAVEIAKLLLRISNE